MNVSILFKQLRLLTFTRYYSQYPKNAIMPIIKEKYLHKVIESGEADILKKFPMRAAHVTESSSIFNEYTVLKMANMIMREGKKAIAQKQLYGALCRIKCIQVEKYHKTTDETEKAQIILDPVRILKMAINNGRPLLKLRPLKRGGSVYQIPVPITNTEAIFRTMKWLVEAAKDKDMTVSFVEKLAAEILDAAHNRGRVVKRKIELHKVCEANRAYAHFRWA